MNEQLKELVSVLSDADVRFWLESGTLLGVCRDGDIIGWDKDIDLGCWSAEGEKLDRVAAELRRRGYRVHMGKRERYGGILTTFMIRPSFREKYRDRKRTAVLAVYFRHDDRALRPGSYFTRSRRKRWTILWLLDEAIRFQLRKVWRRYGYPKRWQLRFPRMELVSYTWSIPAQFFDELTTLEVDGFEVPLPAQWREYLRFRYGNWEVPDPDWVYYRDDGGLVRKPLEDILPEFGHT